MAKKLSNKPTRLNQETESMLPLDPLSAAKERYLSSSQNTSAQSSKPMAQGFFIDQAGVRKPMAYLDLSPEQKATFDAGLEAEKTRGAEAVQSNSDGELALETAATVLTLQQEANVAQQQLQDAMVALDDRMTGLENSDREISLNLENNAVDEANAAANQLSQSSVRAADIGSRLNDQSRRAEASADQFDVDYAAAMGKLEAEKVALNQEIESLKGTVKLNQELFVSNQESLQSMKTQLSNAVATQRQLDNLLASSQTIGDQSRTVDLAVGQAEMAMEKLLFSSPGAADLRAVLGLNISSLDGWIGQLAGERGNNLISQEQYQANLDALNGLKQLILRNQNRLTLPGADIFGDPQARVGSEGVRV